MSRILLPSCPWGKYRSLDHHVPSQRCTTKGGEGGRTTTCFKCSFCPIGRQNSARGVIFSGCSALLVSLNSKRTRNTLQRRRRGRQVINKGERRGCGAFPIDWTENFDSSYKELMALTNFVSRVTRDNRFCLSFSLEISAVNGMHDWHLDCRRRCNGRLMYIVCEIDIPEACYACAACALRTR